MPRRKGYRLYEISGHHQSNFNSPLYLLLLIYRISQSSLMMIWHVTSHQSLLPRKTMSLRWGSTRGVVVYIFDLDPSGSWSFRSARTTLFCCILMVSSSTRVNNDLTYCGVSSVDVWLRLMSSCMYQSNLTIHSNITFRSIELSLWAKQSMT